MIIVQKFGGSSLADASRVMNVARRVVEAYKQGNDVVIVLSAQGKTTDELIERALMLNREPPKRELDMLLVTGEQQSVALMAIAINFLGCPAVSLNANQAGIYTSSNYSNARIKNIDTDRLRAELERRNIVIVTGFQGYNRYEDMTTLGRGGSDTTAVALAAALDADICEIYTDVDGVFTADPRLVKNVRKLDEISYDEMLELATLGAKVLHNRSVELAKKYQVELVVRSSLSNDEGTIVKEECNVEKMLVSGVAVDKDVSRISVVGVSDKPGIAFKLFSLLARYKICIDIILQSVGRHNTQDISFTVAKADTESALKILNDNKELLTAESIVSDDRIAKLSIVGAGMATNPGVAASMFEALFDSGVNISMISTSEIKISVLIDEEDVEVAANAVHEKFDLGGKVKKKR